MIVANSGLVSSVYSHCSASRSFSFLRRASRLDLSAFCASSGRASIISRNTDIVLCIGLPLIGMELWTDGYRIGYEAQKRKVQHNRTSILFALQPVRRTR